MPPIWATEWAWDMRLLHKSDWLLKSWLWFHNNLGFVRQQLEHDTLRHLIFQLLHLTNIWKYHSSNFMSNLLKVLHFKSKPAKANSAFNNKRPFSSTVHARTMEPLDPGSDVGLVLPSHTADGWMEVTQFCGHCLSSWHLCEQHADTSPDLTSCPVQGHTSVRKSFCADPHLAVPHLSGESWQRSAH